MDKFDSKHFISTQLLSFFNGLVNSDKIKGYEEHKEEFWNASEAEDFRYALKMAEKYANSNDTVSNQQKC